MVFEEFSDSETNDVIGLCAPTWGDSAVNHTSRRGGIARAGVVEWALGKGGKAQFYFVRVAVEMIVKS